MFSRLSSRAAKKEAPTDARSPSPQKIPSSASSSSDSDDPDVLEPIALTLEQVTRLREDEIARAASQPPEPPRHPTEEVELVLWWTAEATRAGPLDNSFEVGLIPDERKKRLQRFKDEEEHAEPWLSPVSSGLAPDPAPFRHPRRTRARASPAPPPPAAGTPAAASSTATTPPTVRVAPLPTPGTSTRVRVVARPPAVDLAQTLERLEWAKVWPQAWAHREERALPPALEQSVPVDVADDVVSRWRAL